MIEGEGDFETQSLFRTDEKEDTYLGRHEFAYHDQHARAYVQQNQWNDSSFDLSR